MANDVQIGNAERTAIMHEIGQINAWQSQVSHEIVEIRNQLNTPIATKYKTDYDFGKQVCGDIEKILQQSEQAIKKINGLNNIIRAWLDENARINSAGKFTM